MIINMLDKLNKKCNLIWVTFFGSLSSSVGDVQN